MVTDAMREFATTLDDDARKGLHDHLRRQGRIPQIYESLCWALGWSGLHHVYLGRPGRALAHLVWLALTAAFGFFGLAQVDPTLTSIALGMGALPLGLWGWAILRHKQAVLRYRERLERRLLKVAEKASHGLEAPVDAPEREEIQESAAAG